MAKKSQINRDNRRKELVAKYGERRAELRKKLNDPHVSIDEKLKAFNGNLLRAAVELTKMWRMDKLLRRLDAVLVAADQEHILIITGVGDVVEPDEPIAAIGSGGSYALAAARALLEHTEMDAEAIAREAMGIAASICIYTNDQIRVESMSKGESPAR